MTSTAIFMSSRSSNAAIGQPPLRFSRCNSAATTILIADRGAFQSPEDDNAWPVALALGRPRARMPVEEAGIYRYVQLPAPKVTLKLSGLKKGAVRLGKGVTAKGKVTPRRFAGSKVKLTVQKKRGAKWIAVKTVTRKSSAKGAYSWKYRPAGSGSYRVQATVAKTSRTAAAKTAWRAFKVK